jgi:hypothetical protein
MDAARLASPWQVVHPSWDVSAVPFRWAPPGTIRPWGSTEAGWHALHVAAVTVPESGGWPAGGIPWQEVQVSGVASVHVGVASDPETPASVKLPWQ